ncbi:hypothetical protein [Methylobacterium platani]|uniref:Cell wall-binding protein n=1 Tax=Methylobacterium platani TaxID=427683 RepID=A0A179SDR7_9HYPH|nr:hypothetical protein [Methylobacterium platani]OAS25992.1 cell wall-binding protein [Methylobacterium platani]
MNIRASYETAVRNLCGRVAEMKRDGVPAETIARDVHAERLRLAAHFKALTPEPYRTRIYERTVRVYGNDLGPSIEFLREQGKSWEAIIESAMRPGLPVGSAPETERPVRDGPDPESL